MASIKDDRGYNQGFKPSLALERRTARRADYIINALGKEESKNLLEIGCGTGELSRLLKRKTKLKFVLGTDICQPFIDFAQATYGCDDLKFEILDMRSESKIEEVSEKRFDYVVGNGILHHLYYELDSVLEKIHSILNKNGKMVFLEPNIINPYCFLIFNSKFFGKFANLEPTEKAFSRKTIKQKLISAGFKNIKIEYKDFLLPVTPDSMIAMTVKIGDILEKITPLNMMAQSIFISAQK